MFIIGCHLSVSKGFLAMGKTATAIGGNTFQFFPRNPRGGQAKPLIEEDVTPFPGGWRSTISAPSSATAPTP